MSTAARSARTAEARRDARKQAALADQEASIAEADRFLQTKNIAQVAKVLAHPARVAILQYISRQDACICSDLVEETGLAQATISQHLSEIKKIGLLKGNFQGVRRGSQANFCGFNKGTTIGPG